MNLRIFTVCILHCGLALVATSAYAVDTTSAVKLVYQELEQGVLPYQVTYTVSDDHLRIDDESDSSGFIVFDIHSEKVFSVSHLDKSILVIPDYNTVDLKPEFKIDIEYKLIEDAPKISAKPVYNYRVKAITSATSETCMDIQLVPGLLPQAADSLRAFQKIVSGQHVINLEKTPDEFRTPCYLVDQVYNKGDYYSKGFPIQEWHSNGRMRQLLDYKETEVDTSIFTIPEEYRQYSLQ
ncbi:MAG: hypothetical protein WBO14_12315 [Gammaproteobacteria bacterium]